MTPFVHPVETPPPRHTPFPHIKAPRHLMEQCITALENNNTDQAHELFDLMVKHVASKIKEEINV
jgi:hypothetical protein